MAIGRIPTGVKYYPVEMFTIGQEGYLEKLIPFNVNVRDYKAIMLRYCTLCLTYCVDAQKIHYMYNMDSGNLYFSKRK